jgi:hypothetical protein
MKWKTKATPIGLIEGHTQAKAATDTEKILSLEMPQGFGTYVSN